MKRSCAVGSLVMVSLMLSACTRRLPLLADGAHSPAHRHAMESVVRLTTSPMSGSAVSIGASRLLTACHVLPQAMHDGSLEANLRIEGLPSRVRLLARGGGETPEEDWAVLEVIWGPVPRAIRVDPDLELDEGDPITVIGFPSRGGKPWEPDERVMRIFETRVASRPPFMSGGEELIYMTAPTRRLTGMSGGAVVARDDAGEYVLVALAYGMMELDFLGQRFAGRLIGRRVPAEAVAK